MVTAISTIVAKSITMAAGVDSRSAWARARKPAKRRRMKPSADKFFRKCLRLPPPSCAASFKRPCMRPPIA